MKKTIFLTAFAGILLSGCAELLPNFNNAGSANSASSAPINNKYNPLEAKFTCKIKEDDFCSTNNIGYYGNMQTTLVGKWGLCKSHYKELRKNLNCK